MKYTREAFMGLRATPKSDESLKIAVELAKIIRAGERLRELLPQSTNQQTAQPAQAAPRGPPLVHRKQPERAQHLAMTDAVFPEMPSAAPTVQKYNGICDLCLEPCEQDLGHDAEQLPIFGFGFTRGCRCAAARQSPSGLGCLSLHRAGELVFTYFWQKTFLRFAASDTWLVPLVAMLIFAAPRVAARL